MTTAIAEPEVEAEPTCRHCGGDRYACGPLVKGDQYGPEYIGLRHVPKLGATVDRRHGGRLSAYA